MQRRCRSHDSWAASSACLMSQQPPTAAALQGWTTSCSSWTLLSVHCLSSCTSPHPGQHSRSISSKVRRRMHSPGRAYSSRTASSMCFQRASIFVLSCHSSWAACCTVPTGIHAPSADSAAAAERPTCDCCACCCWHLSQAASAQRPVPREPWWVASPATQQPLVCSGEQQQLQVVGSQTGMTHLASVWPRSSAEHTWLCVIVQQGVLTDCRCACAWLPAGYMTLIHWHSCRRNESRWGSRGGQQ